MDFILQQQGVFEGFALLSQSERVLEFLLPGPMRDLALLLPQPVHGCRPPRIWAVWPWV